MPYPILPASFRGRRGVHPRNALLLFVVLLPGFGQSTAHAQVEPSDPYRFVAWTVEDGRALAGHAASRKALYGGAALGGLLVVLSWQDARLTSGAVDLADGLYRPVLTTANEIGNVKVVQPMALMLFLGSLTSRSTRMQDAAFTSLEALVFANTITDVLKGLVGRHRPTEGDNAHVFVPFSGHRSFPSGHATTVFAFTTPWLLYYGNARTAVLFLMGTGTAFTRMADRQHWFTDVVAGTAIGFTTAFWLTRRHRQGAAEGLSVAPTLAGGRLGLALRMEL
ncbi:MAG: phosphatase PAP2 family protein [Rhodothermales bacterium]|nr:phosphatase PAP2 family protein [Rhodothermales bacterium]